ncbi:MAG: succinylglutamate desuccinylase/aspartoacylase family protein, partial [Candidatus Peregrinibacteria bacterium]|nr:succinylglutamate desuccinylase/aspartoacylase family protein [Candidatus Peregrinibacteria bacterium]
MVQRKGKPGMLALEAFNKYKVPILTVEMGGAQHQDDEFIKKGIAGIYNTLRFYKMVPGKVKKNKEPFLLKRRFGLRSPETAVIKFKVNLGDFVHAGDEFGTLYYPQHYSEEPFFSPLCGLVFSLHDRQIIKKNKRICSILEQENCHIMKKTLKTNEIKM